MLSIAAVGVAKASAKRLISPSIKLYQVAHAQDRKDASFASELCFELFNRTSSFVADLLAIKRHNDSDRRSFEGLNRSHRSFF